MTSAAPLASAVDPALDWAADGWRSSRWGDAFVVLPASPLLERGTLGCRPAAMPTAVVVEPMVVDGLDLEGLPALECVAAPVLELPGVEGLRGELPPLALEHADPAPSLKPGLSRTSPLDDPGRC